MIIAYDNLVGELVDATDDEVAEAKRCVSFIVKGAEYSEAYANGWDGTKSFVKYKRVPTGLIPELCRKMSNVKLLDRRKQVNNEYKDIALYDINLRGYQKEAVNEFVEHERGIVRLSTRAGKTVIAVACTQRINVPTVFITHTKPLLNQSYRDYRQLIGGKIGIIGGGKWQPERITCATIQTLASRIKRGDADALKFLESRYMVVFDEIHRASDRYKLVSRYMPNARWRLGLSATACISGRENELDSMAITGPIIYDIPMADLVDKGMIAKPKVFFVDGIPYGKKMPRHAKWDDVYECGIVSNQGRNLTASIIAVDLSRVGKRVMILVEKREHGKILEEMISRKVTAKYVDGLSDSLERETALHDIQSGNIDVLVSTRIFNEGINIPTLDCVIIAGGYKSPILLYQRYGRPITKTGSKESATIIDFVDRAHFRLLEHSEDRMQICGDQPAFDMEVISASDIGRIVNGE